MTHHHASALHTAALAAAERGWHVFPLAPGSKRPAVKAWEERATTDPERIARCWSAGDFGIGLATGPSGLLVLDLDTAKHAHDTPPEPWREAGVRDGADVLALLCERNDQALPVETFTVRTASGGEHLYFTAPAGARLRNTAGALGWKVDTRAGGGYVVAAGSIVGGQAYSAIHDAPAAQLPDWLATLLAPARKPAAVTDGGGWLARVQRASAYAEAAVTNEVSTVRAAREGGRNATLLRAARALGRLVGAGSLPYEVASEALQSAGEACGLPSRECASTIRSGLNWAARSVRGTA